MDKDDPDPMVLRLACAWAHLVARRAAARAGEGPSLERMRELVAEAQRCMDRASGIRRCHSTASRAVSEAADKLNDMLEAIVSALGKLEVEVSAPSP